MTNMKWKAAISGPTGAATNGAEFRLLFAFPRQEEDGWPNLSHAARLSALQYYSRTLTWNCDSEVGVPRP